MIFTIDLKDVLGGKDVNGTVLPPRASCEDSDFEQWTVTKERSTAPMCVLGKHHTFHRIQATRRESACLLPKTYSLAESETKVWPTPLLLRSATEAPAS